MFSEALYKEPGENVKNMGYREVEIELGEIAMVITRQDPETRCRNKWENQKLRNVHPDENCQTGDGWMDFGN